MQKITKIGILKETKMPPDKRVIFTPTQCVEVHNQFPNIEIVIQRSELRCFADSEYEKLGIKLVDNVDDCNLLIGIKEVNISTLIANKIYLFFSHTAKKQSHNKKLLQAIVEKNITLLDYEYLTDSNNQRLVAFGKWAGIVGTYNALIAIGKRYNFYELKRAKDCFDYNELKQQLTNLKLPNLKILITGSGRVGTGSLEILSQLNIKKVNSDDFLNKTFSEPVICQIDANEYVQRIDGEKFNFQHFYSNPKMYESTFKKFTEVADVYLACHFWDKDSPKFITKNDLKSDKFNLKIIADISCDVGGPIDSTLRASTIAEPFYGYNPKTELEDEAWNLKNITVMAIDNLPGELPRDSSEFFGQNLIDKVLPSLLNATDYEKIIHRSCIVKNGELTFKFTYLEEFIGNVAKNGGFFIEKK